VESDVEGPFDTNEGTPEEIQDAIRRRLQRLPRGLQPGEEQPMGVGPEGQQRQQGQQGQPGQPNQPGVNLVPAAPPNDIFRPTPPPEQTPPPEEVEPPPPSAGLFSTPNASPTSALANPRVMLGSFRSERSAEAGGGESRRGAAAVRLWLEPQQPAAAVGDELTVAVDAEAARGISHLPLTLSYDPARLAFIAVRPGQLLGGPGEAQVMADASHPGQLVVGASRLGDRPAVTGGGTVAWLTFRALASGPVEVGFARAQALDGALRPVLPLRTSAAEIDIGNPRESRSRQR
jgi:cohesin domain-containing protein